MKKKTGKMNMANSSAMKAPMPTKTGAMPKTKFSRAQLAHGHAQMRKHGMKNYSC